MKHRIKLRRKDGIRQRYWKNYGSQMFRNRINKTIRFSDEISPHQRRIVVRTIEKNPHLLERMHGTEFGISNDNSNWGESFPNQNKVLLNPKILRGVVIEKEPNLRSIHQVTPRKVIEHESSHLISRYIPEERLEEYGAQIMSLTDIRNAKTGNNVKNEAFRRMFHDQ